MSHLPTNTLFICQSGKDFLMDIGETGESFTSDSTNCYTLIASEHSPTS